MNNAIYDTIDKYVISAVCAEPLHVGSASNARGEVLIHPVENVPFIQSTGICGVLRSYCAKTTDVKIVNNLFGNTEDSAESKIKISDGVFTANEKLQMELRPRVKINNESGTVAAVSVKGTGEIFSGQKFDIQYVAAGAEFSFEIYIYGGTKEENELVKKCLAALNANEIQVGGQKSNGCGFIKVQTVKYRHYNMKKSEDRKLWFEEKGLVKIELPKLAAKDYLNAYEIEVIASTESELLVKGIAIEDFSKDAPKATNMKNAQGNYIVPGSSVKGAIRNRMEMIAAYMELDETLISYAFGKSEDETEHALLGNLKFRDISITKKEKHAGTASGGIKRTRIRIDKFTGGVMNGALFNEVNVSGKMDMRIYVADGKAAPASTALLLLALRDLAYKMYTLGGGQNVGKGYVNVEKITVKDLKRNQNCTLSFQKEKGYGFELFGKKEVMERCMQALKAQKR